MPKKYTISNRVHENNNVNEKSFKYIHNIENEPAPMNEYLSYDLSSQINNGLFEVKILAEEIKQIKKEKL